MPKRLFLFLFLVLSFGLMTTQASIETTLHTLEHDDITRTYHLYEPDGAVNGVIIALHPFGSNGRAMEILTGLNDQADQYGFAIAYPDSAQYYWDDGRVDAGLSPQNGNVDDVGFLAALGDTLAEEYSLDRQQVFLTGFNEGAKMAYRVACETPEHYGGIAPVSALMWEHQYDACPDASTATNMLILHGDDDHFYKPAGHRVPLADNNYYVVFGSRPTFSIFAERNGCAGDATIQDNLRLHSTCDNNTQTALVTVLGGGNNWFRMGDYQLNQFGVDASNIVAAFFAGDDAWIDHATQTEPYTEIPRTFKFFVPTSYDDDTPAPLVVLLHGKTANANHQAYVSDMNSIAEREGFVTVYPEGLNTEWNMIRDLPSYPNLDSHNDEVFIETLIQDLMLDLNLDESRMYVTGLSNGGFMTQRLLCTMQDRFAAGASVAATGTFGLPDFCAEKDPMPIMYIHGTKDTIVPWDGQPAQNSQGLLYWVSAPMDRTLGFWGSHNNCGSTMTTTDLPRRANDTFTRILEVDDCPDDAPIVLYMVVGGGHVWHGSQTKDSEFLGAVSDDFEASEVIWAFFTNFTLGE